MKKSILVISVLLAAVFIFTGCRDKDTNAKHDNEVLTFDELDELAELEELEELEFLQELEELEALIEELDELEE